MVKADDNVVFDEEHPESFTEFEYLKARLSQVERVLDQHADILIDNNLVLTKENKAAYINEEEETRSSDAPKEMESRLFFKEHFSKKEPVTVEDSTE